jgi:two-component system, OmpR family, sensor histidine kinase ResE
MRWWLAAVFILIAILTAVLIAGVSSREANRDLRANAQSIAVGNAVAAGFTVEQAIVEGDLGRQLVSIGGQHGLALFVFAPNGQLLAQYGLRSVRWVDIPDRNVALAGALHDRRFVKTFDGGKETVVSLPLHRTQTAAALVAYAPREPSYPAASAIFRNEVLRSSVWAVLAAAVTGLIAAWLIARRLRRIGDAAAAIERGDFARTLQPRFYDEVGALAETIDRMRQRLGDAFEQLGAERDQLGRLLEQFHEGVLAVDRELRVQFANANAETFFGGERFVPGDPLPDTLGGLPLREVAKGLFVPGAPVAEARSRDEHGSTISLRGVPASTSDLAMLVLSDITESERRHEAERDFVTNASHELRTPVSAIVGAVEALRTGADGDPAARDRFIDLIGRQTTRLTRLTNSLLTLARAQTQQLEIELEPVELGPLLEEIAATTVSAEPVAVRVEPGAELVAVGHRDILEQVISNLVENAVKHTTSGDVVLSAAETAGGAEIRITDTGSGIPAHARPRIFDRFYTGDRTRHDGFGLGLAIARDLTEAIGGTLTIESRNGHGTIATVALSRPERT